MSEFVEASERGTLKFKMLDFGRSVSGIPLRYIPAAGEPKTLVIAGTHGEEGETVFFLSRALRALKTLPKNAAFILAANPDGLLLGTRGNAHGVDLNRNFPTKNFTLGKTLSRPTLEAKRELKLLTGTGKAPEPETASLIKLIQALKPQTIISIHSPIGCIDAPERTELVRNLESLFKMKWLPDIGYPTPGSLGTWCKENGIFCVTLELDRRSGEELVRDFAEPFASFLLRL